MNKCSYVNIKEMSGKGNIMKKTYKIDVDCANCANKMEEAARIQPVLKMQQLIS